MDQLDQKANDADTKLIGYGLGGILVLAIVFGVELFNGPPPSISSLQPFSGQLIDKHVSADRSRIFVDIQVRSGTQDVILFQQVSEKLAVVIQELPPGKTVNALIAPKSFVDQRTGLPRYSMWQLAVNEQGLFSFDEITRFITSQTERWRTFAYWSGALGVICFVAVGFRRWRRHRSLDAA